MTAIQISVRIKQVKMKKNKFILTAVFLLLSFCCAWALSFPKLFPFNKKNSLHEWEEKVFKNKVIYRVEPKKEGGYLLADSKQANSGLLHKLKFYPKEYPMISWKWKVLKFPDKAAKSSGGWVEKDDYAARVYVIFPSWIFTNIKCLEYVWDETLPEGKIMSSPYLGNIKLVIAESGSENLNQWVFEEHNIYEDYLRAFGKPPGRVGAIALMTDTDNTLSSAEALYTQIKVGYKKWMKKETEEKESLLTNFIGKLYRWFSGRR